MLKHSFPGPTLRGFYSIGGAWGFEFQTDSLKTDTQPTKPPRHPEACYFRLWQQTRIFWFILFPNPCDIINNSSHLEVCLHVRSWANYFIVCLNSSLQQPYEVGFSSFTVTCLLLSPVTYNESSLSSSFVLYPAVEPLIKRIRGI